MRSADKAVIFVGTTDLAALVRSRSSRLRSARSLCSSFVIKASCLPPSIFNDRRVLIPLAMPPSPTQPHGEDFQNILKPVIDDLRQLVHFGKFYDTADNEYEEVITIPDKISGDVPARNYLLNHRHHGAKANLCIDCTVSGTSLALNFWEKAPMRDLDALKTNSDTDLTLPTFAERKAQILSAGNDYSELWRLPYSTPKMLALGWMHLCQGASVRALLLLVTLAVGAYEDKTLRRPLHVAASWDVGQP